MKSGELQRVHKAERNPDKSIIRSAKDHKNIREDLRDISDQVVREGAWCAGVFSASFSFAGTLAAAPTSAAGREMLLRPSGGRGWHRVPARGDQTRPAQLVSCAAIKNVSWALVLFVCLFVSEHTRSCF